MRIEKGLLSKNIQNKYNYILTKKEVSKFVEELLLIEYKIKTIEFSPKTSSYGLDRNHFTSSKRSREEEFLIRKESFEEKYKTKKAVLDKVIKTSFTDLEKQIYIYSFEESMTTEEIADLENTCDKRIRLIKKSLILKLAIGLQIAVENH